MRVVFFIFITIFLTGCGSRKKNITTSKKTSKEISQVVLQNAKTDQTSIIPIFKEIKYSSNQKIVSRSK